MANIAVNTHTHKTPPLSQQNTTLQHTSTSSSSLLRSGSLSVPGYQRPVSPPPATPLRSASSHTGWPLSLSMRHHQSSSHWETSTHTLTHTQLSALTADDCPWFRCFSEAENLAQRHAPFHIHNVVFKGSKFKRDSRRSCVQRRRDGLTAAPLNPPGSYKYTAGLRWHSVQTRCDPARLLDPADGCFCRPQNTPNKRAGEESTAASKRFILAFISPPSSLLGVSGCERRTDKATCYFPIAD